MITFALSTLGCKVNAYESNGYIEGLRKFGWQLVDFKEKADIYIINTCSVTNTAASKSKQKIHQAQRRNPDAIICVVGCFVQTTKEELNVDVLVGSSGKEQLPQYIFDALQSREKKSYVKDLQDVTKFENIPIQTFEGQTRAYLKIQDGCNQFCSYCIIPYARGRERSLPIDEVVATAKKLVANHHKEIVLSGIHTGRYGLDLKTNLLALLKQLVAIEGLERVRISSIEMNELDDAFLLFMSRENKIAKHLHIPIQSGSDTILKAMNRPYTIAQFKKKMEHIRELMPNVSISSDIIMGFPGESEEDVIETVTNLEAIHFSFLHVFPFSKRDGTKASEMKYQVINEEKKKRCQKVSLLSKKHYNEYKEKFVNQMVNVLFEYEKDGYLFGHTSEYLSLMAKKDRHQINQMCTVLVTSIQDGTLFSE